MNFFDNCMTWEELKKEYHRLAVKHHPDLGGDIETMKTINSQFETVSATLKNKHTNAVGENYTKETTETAAQYMDIINKIIHFMGVKIEICGSWVWVSGNTKEYKEQLKEIGFKWSKNKIAWYYHAEPYHKKSKKAFSLDDIRDMWGNEEVVTKQQRAFAR